MHERRSVGDSQAFHELRAVTLDGLDTHFELESDLLDVLAFRDQMQNLDRKSVV